MLLVGEPALSIASAANTCCVSGCKVDTLLASFHRILADLSWSRPAHARSTGEKCFNLQLLLTVQPRSVRHVSGHCERVITMATSEEVWGERSDIDIDNK